MDHAIAGANIGLDHGGGFIQHHFAVNNGDLNWLTFNRHDFLHLHNFGRVFLAWHNVVGQDCREGFWIFLQCGHGFWWQLCKGRVGWCEHGEWSSAVQCVNQARGCDKFAQRVELTSILGCLNNGSLLCGWRGGWRSGCLAVLRCCIYGNAN